MLINELNTTLPNKKDEEFLKINFDSLFSYDFKKSKNSEFDIMGLETIKDENFYESCLAWLGRPAMGAARRASAGTSANSSSIEPAPMTESIALRSASVRGR